MHDLVRHGFLIMSTLLAAACGTDAAAPPTAAERQRAVQQRLDALNWALVDWYAAGGRGTIVAVAVDSTQPQHLFLVRAR